jgi:hypothetical protein
MAGPEGYGLSDDELASLGAAANGPSAGGSSTGGDPAAPTSMPAAPIPTTPIVAGAGGSSTGGDPGQPSSAAAWQPAPGSAANPLPLQVTNPLAGSVGYSGDKNGAPPPVDLSSLMQPPTPQVTTTSGSTVQKGIPLSAETKALRAQGTADMQKGQALEEDSLAGSQAAQHNAAQQIARMNQDAAAQAMSDQAKTEAALAPQRDAIKRATDDIVNRKRETYWQSKSTGSRIALALASGLGAFGANYKIGGGHDAAADVIKAATEDYQHTEDAKDEQSKAGLNAKVAAYGLDSSAFHDNDQKRQAIRVMQLNAAAAQVQDEASKSSDPLERAKMMQVHAQVSQAAAQASAHLDEMTANKVTTHSSSTTTAGGATGGISTDRVVQGPDGKSYMLASPQAAQKFRETAAAVDRVNQKTKELQDLYANESPHMPFSDAKAKATTLVTELREAREQVDKLRNSGQTAADWKQVYGEGAPGLDDWHLPLRAKTANDSANQERMNALREGGAQLLGNPQVAVAKGGKPVVLPGTGQPQ